MDARSYAAAERIAGGELFGRYSGLVRHVLTRTLGVDPDLNELVHDVILLAIRRVETLESPAAVPSWMVTTASLKARARVRHRVQQQRLKAVLLHHAGEPRADDHDGREALRAVYRVLDTLRPQSRVAFSLRYLEGMSLREIAATCQVSIPTIKRRLSTARQHFVRRALQEPALRHRLRQGSESPARRLPRFRS